MIDRSVRLVYQEYLHDPSPDNMPILEDLYNVLSAQPEKEAARLASALELYVTGALNVFNHRTNVDLNNRLACFDIKALGKQRKKLGIPLQESLIPFLREQRKRQKEDALAAEDTYQNKGYVLMNEMGVLH